MQWTSRWMASGLAMASMPWAASGCSHFAMENDFALTGRTMDLGNIPGASWTVLTVPRGSKGLRSSKYGYVGFVLKEVVIVEDIVFAGVNDAGLSCDLNALLGTQYPQPSKVLDNLDAFSLCRWALEGFGSVAELKEGLKAVNFVKTALTLSGAHWAFRDAVGGGVILEFLEGALNVYDDNNDGGKTGFGIMTNEPPLVWHIQAVKHMQWKQSLARSAVAMPGNFYPDERFQRVHLVKSAMPKPASYEEAFAQTVHVLNTITVPFADIIGTDSGNHSGEGSSDHTQWAVVYDHKTPTVYFRSVANQNFQRLRLSDLHLDGGPKKALQVTSPRLPWFSDAAALLQPTGTAQLVV